MKRFILFLLLFPSILFPVTLEVTPEEKELILRALAVYRDMNAGRFTIITVQSNDTTLVRTIHVAGQKYVFTDTIEVEVKERRHIIGITGGMGVGLFYGFRPFPRLGFILEGDYTGQGHLRGGVFFQL